MRFLSIIIIVVAAVGGFVLFNKKQSDAPRQGSPAQDYTNAGYVYFGNEARGDLDGDGVADVAFILTKQDGGSGTFYYVGVAFAVQNGYAGTNAVFLGDRIAPQTTEIRDGQLIVNYADRRSDEPMTAKPTVGVSKYLRIVNGIIQESDGQ